MYSNKELNQACHLIDTEKNPEVSVKNHPYYTQWATTEVERYSYRMELRLYGVVLFLKTYPAFNKVLNHFVEAKAHEEKPWIDLLRSYHVNPFCQILSCLQQYAKEQKLDEEKQVKSSSSALMAKGTTRSQLEDALLLDGGKYELIQECLLPQDTIGARVNFYWKARIYQKKLERLEKSDLLLKVTDHVFSSGFDTFKEPMYPNGFRCEWGGGSAGYFYNGSESFIDFLQNNIPDFSPGRSSPFNYDWHWHRYYFNLYREELIFNIKTIYQSGHPKFKRALLILAKRCGYKKDTVDNTQDFNTLLRLIHRQISIIDMLHGNRSIQEPILPDGIIKQRTHKKHLPDGLDKEQVKDLYRKTSLLLHPDRFQNKPKEEVDAAKKAFQELQQEYQEYLELLDKSDPAHAKAQLQALFLKNTSAIQYESEIHDWIHKSLDKTQLNPLADLISALQAFDEAFAASKTSLSNTQIGRLQKIYLEILEEILGIRKSPEPGQKPSEKTAVAATEKQLLFVHSSPLLLASPGFLKSRKNDAVKMINKAQLPRDEIKAVVAEVSTSASAGDIKAETKAGDSSASKLEPEKLKLEGKGDEKTGSASLPPTEEPRFTELVRGALDSYNRKYQAAVKTNFLGMLISLKFKTVGPEQYTHSYFEILAHITSDVLCSQNFWGQAFTKDDLCSTNGIMGFNVYPALSNALQALTKEVPNEDFVVLRHKVPRFLQAIYFWLGLQTRIEDKSFIQPAPDIYGCPVEKAGEAKESKAVLPVFANPQAQTELFECLQMSVNGKTLLHIAMTEWKSPSDTLGALVSYLSPENISKCIHACFDEAFAPPEKKEEKHSSEDAGAVLAAYQKQASLYRAFSDLLPLFQHRFTKQVLGVVCTTILTCHDPHIPESQEDPTLKVLAIIPTIAARSDKIKEPLDFCALAKTLLFPQDQHPYAPWAKTPQRLEAVFAAFTPYIGLQEATQLFSPQKESEVDPRTQKLDLKTHFKNPQLLLGILKGVLKTSHIESALLNFLLATGIYDAIQQISPVDNAPVYNELFTLLAGHLQPESLSLLLPFKHPKNLLPLLTKVLESKGQEEKSDLLRETKQETSILPFLRKTGLLKAIAAIDAARGGEHYLELANLLRQHFSDERLNNLMPSLKVSVGKSHPKVETSSEPKELFEVVVDETTSKSAQDKGPEQPKTSGSGIGAWIASGGAAVFKPFRKKKEEGSEPEKQLVLVKQIRSLQ